MAELPETLKTLLQDADVLQYFEVAGSKLRCTLNGHCVPLEQMSQIRTLISGKKFQKLVAADKERTKLEQLQPFIVPSKHAKGYLFCALTKQLIRDSYDVARQHMKGQRFLRAKERFLNDELELLEEEGNSAKIGRKKGIDAADAMAAGGGAEAMAVDGDDEERGEDEGSWPDCEFVGMDAAEVSDAEGGEEGTREMDASCSEGSASGEEKEAPGVLVAEAQEGHTGRLKHAKAGAGASAAATGCARKLRKAMARIEPKRERKSKKQKIK